MVLRLAADLHLAAVFLTRLPLPALPHDPPPLARTLWAFPVVGAGVGLAAGAVLGGALLAGLPALVAALLAVAVAAWITGALHEDGLSDVADGFGSGATRERKLEILRDSRIGAHGALALVLAVGLKAAALAALGAVDAVLAVTALAASAALGRAAVGPLLHGLAPARGDGLGVMAGRPSGLQVAASVVVAVALAAGLLRDPLAVGLAVAAAALATLAVGVMARRHIGGHTGDVLGAAVLSAEVAVLVALSAMV